MNGTAFGFSVGAWLASSVFAQGTTNTGFFRILLQTNSGRLPPTVGYISGSTPLAARMARGRIARVWRCGQRGPGGHIVERRLLNVT